MEYRELGNIAFSKQNYKEAIEQYSKAIQEDPLNCVNYTNRALCYLRTNENELALADSFNALQIDPSNPKAWFRHAVASANLKDNKTALLDLRRAMTLSSDGSITSLYNQLKKEEYPGRCCGNVVIPESNIKNEEQEYKGEITFRILKEFIEEGKYPKTLIRSIIKKSKKILNERNAINYINCSNIRIIGDIHGQFSVVSRIAEEIEENQQCVLFNGDLVDRGSRGLECIIGILTLIIEYPTLVYLNRGNHEDKELNTTFGFYAEAINKVGLDIYKEITELYISIPLGHVIRDSVFVVHGGIPIEPVNIKRAPITKKEKYEEFDIENAFLWADPQIKNGSSKSPRLIGRTFGPDILLRFLYENNLKFIVRSHEVKKYGFEWDVTGKLLSLFSAPKYEGLDNVGAYADLWFDQEESPELPHFTVSTFKDFDIRDHQ
ncbi:hypothetical protein ENUP19_0368G0042 [Entamoeba nuttalli]|uniref:Serine/threonine-protein phosphatase n=2 Tax=Entamoeba nuttalli TaxID=412467 RepID=K2HRY0_ENTNP|nr:protein phosphatase, putative [Entamoeba nuttalli P19]EKE38790.1 protein phosphatase, putative [Entamoeba nuttalli P19]|eukprot:XP_008858871.1 protein phosphatase, putative [Entamoeba nuttalli P19]